MHYLFYVLIASIATIVTQIHLYPFSIEMGCIVPLFLLLGIWQRRLIENRTCLLLISALLAHGFIAKRTTTILRNIDNDITTLSTNPVRNICGSIHDISMTSSIRYPYKISLSHCFATNIVCNTSTPLYSNITIYTKSISHLEIGDIITIDNPTLKPAQLSSSYGWYSYREKSCASLFASSLQCSIVRPDFHLYRYIFQARENVFNGLKTSIPSKTFSLFASLFLGNKSVEPVTLSHIQDKLSLWGIAHFLARSGAHLIIVINILLKILQYIPISIIIKRCIALIVCSVYYALSWSSIPFIRSFITLTLNTMAFILQSPSHSLYTITLVCLLMLMHNPLLLFFIDFQFTFLMTYAIAWFNYINPSFNYLRTTNYCSR